MALLHSSGTDATFTYVKSITHPVCNQTIPSFKHFSSDTIYTCNLIIFQYSQILMAFFSPSFSWTPTLMISISVPLFNSSLLLSHNTPSNNPSLQFHPEYFYHFPFLLHSFSWRPLHPPPRQIVICFNIPWRFLSFNNFFKK